MIAGVITVPERAAALRDLRALIEPSVDHFEVFNDERHQGHFWNLSRCMTAMLNSAKQDEPVLIMTDDATTVPAWRAHWEAIHAEAKSDIYVLFSRQRHMFRADRMARGYVTKAQPRGFYDQAMIFINHHGLMDAVLDWFNNRGGRDHPKVIKRRNHLNVVIQEYLIEHGYKWTTTVPTIFDHKPMKSIIGASDVGRSFSYIGDA